MRQYPIPCYNLIGVTRKEGKVMESVLKTAYSVLPFLSKEELTQLQSKIGEMLHEEQDTASPFHPLTELEWAARLDESIAEFDVGKGYSADEMCQSLRKRFGWV